MRARDSVARLKAFWSRVNKDGPVHPALGTACWDWPGCDEMTYGSFSVEGRRTPAHRVSLAESLGRDIRQGMFACHHCDRRCCVRPEHLYEGTPMDNNMDKMRRGRMGNPGRPLLDPSGGAKSLVFRIPEPTWARLSERAEASGVTVSALVRAALERHL